jgi:hypothetical protein
LVMVALDMGFWFHRISGTGCAIWVVLVVQDICYWLSMIIY